ncbi:NAD(+)/NADH kinase [Sinanaerobacter chloroacetimidivorans]|uniref:NAD(+)/NADH kinase n=1 Tax=Sinanaerobacter chloroacetimidivorans TaxID=2818044 RepID=A0A8J7W5X3_9FIRM|nr:NAD(+)/NADH kinase [Sinanaerobacter chloroacetimidivorans]MBR0599923.1 NAD(+)/NADH kinase [Sinanaerobacter chloroacetimidivorans]
MGTSIGIIANPASGKDIRRLVSYATVIDNQEKINILKRIVLAAQSFGVGHIFFMPDSFQMGWRVTKELLAEGRLQAECKMLEMTCKDCTHDSTAAAKKMEELGVGCVVVLGGDGTSRAVAKGIRETPILPVSTGTNNVYPMMVEGTVAGMAAAFAAGAASPKEVCCKDKRIELYVNGKLADIALIDAVITMDHCVGARAVWDLGRIREIAVTRCHPASIGFSAIPGSLAMVSPEDDFGYLLQANHSADGVLAPVAAGLLQGFGVGEHGRLMLNQDYEYQRKGTCMAALDGERELLLREEDSLVLRITREGPWRVDVRGTLEKACREGRFRQERLPKI